MRIEGTGIMLATTLVILPVRIDMRDSRPGRGGNVRIGNSAPSKGANAGAEAVT